MSNLKYYDYEGFGERSKRDLNYSQAVVIGDRIEISGQGGWDRITEEYPKDLNEEIDQAFDNVEHALKTAGGNGLDQVYKLRIYVTGDLDDYLEGLARNLKGRFKKHGPLATVVRVVGLYKIMRIEIEAEAFIGSAC